MVLLVANIINTSRPMQKSTLIFFLLRRNGEQKEVMLTPTL